MRRYPIVRRRALRPRWRWSAWRERRSPLAAGRDETLVYEIDGTFATGVADPARATAVSLVDVGRRDVHAGWELAASDLAWDFPVTLTFHCTVVDPVAVVRARRTGGVWDVRRVLAADPRPGTLHRRHPDGDEDGLRRALTALLAPRPAYQEIPGVRVELAWVDVGPAALLDIDEA
ncbi:hypothetical protein [Streptomyces aurantiogriseus]|uniref:Uncharacterized protein n=1 Tax=Streptomyces aurantiogriseus TaxID=66870 RepID=A0A918CK89_9ACTN|nr:hypothetical protein [Streptomyces aurantiogriseus]GGR25965.1 hypothetical protein GCM10010251_47640 [Streptomyces aurantiogriseus]